MEPWKIPSHLILQTQTLQNEITCSASLFGELIRQIYAIFYSVLLQKGAPTLACVCQACSSATLWMTVETTLMKRAVLVTAPTTDVSTVQTAETLPYGFVLPSIVLWMSPLCVISMIVEYNKICAMSISSLLRYICEMYKLLIIISYTARLQTFDDCMLVYVKIFKKAYKAKYRQ